MVAGRVCRSAACNCSGKSANRVAIWQHRPPAGQLPNSFDHFPPIVASDYAATVSDNCYPTQFARRVAGAGGRLERTVEPNRRRDVLSVARMAGNFLAIQWRSSRAAVASAAGRRCRRADWHSAAGGHPRIDPRGARAGVGLSTEWLGKFLWADRAEPAGHARGGT